MLPGGVRYEMAGKSGIVQALCGLIAVRSWQACLGADGFGLVGEVWFGRQGEPCSGQAQYGKVRSGRLGVLGFGE